MWGNIRGKQSRPWIGSHGAIEFDSCPDVGQRVMSLLWSKLDSEILAKCSELEVVRSWQRLVFVEQPHGSLHRAEDSIRGGEEQIEALEPCSQECAVKVCVVSDQLRNDKWLTVRAVHV